MIDWAAVRTELLPRSGIGVVRHWLVIAPPRNPVIRIDLRALDTVAVQTDEAPSDELDDGRDDDNDQDAYDPGSTLILACGDLEVALYVEEGPEATERVAREAALHTRAAAEGQHAVIDRSRLLIVGNDPVTHVGAFIRIGDCAYRISEVREYALRGANIPLTGGRVLQAAMALLVVAVTERDTPAS